MTRTEMTEGQLPEVVVDGATVSVGGHPVDLEAVQTEGEAVVTFSWGKNGQVIAGARADRGYAAQVIVPPARYEWVETGEADEDGQPETAPQRLAVDVSAVRLLLWARP